VSNDYLDLTQLIERLHRRYLDVIRAELNRLRIKDINAVQALLLNNIGEDEIIIRELIERGYYQGSNVSYNIKKLVDHGYIEQERSAHDKRSVRIKLTEKAREMCQKIHTLEERNAQELDTLGVTSEEVKMVSDTMRRLERLWSDYINYGP
jgi:DNA-binding MarR family transcriptional regulator